jgi:hypothetical protein
MRTEVYINDSLIDVDKEQTVAASYGNIVFGKLAKRKGVKSNTWTAPFTPRNKDVFESCEVQGSYSLIPYRRATIRVEIDGVVVFEGFCTLQEAKESYEVQSFAGASDFYAIINNKKLTELDLSEWAHVWNEPNIKNSWTNIEGYVYAFVEYGKENPFYLEGNQPDYFLPQLFFHSIVKQIATDAGYSLMGDVLDNPRFLKHLIIANKFPLPIAYGGTWDLSTLLPDLTQSKIWLDFANIYGLQFDIDDITKEIRANFIDDILFNEPEIWTGKVDKSERVGTKYRFDEFGQTSYLRYKHEEITESNPVYQDFQKAVSIDDHVLQLEADIYKSEFFMIQDVDPVLFPNGRATTRTFVLKPGKGFSGIWNDARAYLTTNIVWLNGTYWEAIDDSTNEPPSSSPLFWKSIPEKDIWDTKSRPMYGALTIDPVSDIYIAFDPVVNVSRIVNNTDMDWEYTYQHHYRLFNRIIDRTKRIEPLIKLNYADINQLDFTKAKQIDNELYFLEEVVQFRLNERESTICNLVRI